MVYKMKKLLLILSVLLLLVGCGSAGNLNDDEVKDLFKTSMSAVESNTNVDLDMDTNSDEMVGKVKIQIRNIDDLEKAQAAMEMDAEGIQMSYYLDQGYLYMDMFGMKMKSKAEAEDFEEMFNVDDMVAGEFDFNDIDFELFKVEQDNSNVIYSINIDDTMEEFDGATGSVKITVDKKSKTVVYLEMDVKMEGMSTKIVADYNAKGAIEMPDFEGYSDLSDVE